MLTNVINLFSDYTFQVVALGVSALGILSGVTGTYATLRNESLLGDALSHAALPGIALAFMITGEKKLPILLLGAALVGLFATWLIQYVTRTSKIKKDSAMALTIAAFFGFGMVLLSYIQRQPSGNQAGLDKFIYGQASTMLQSESYLTVLITVLVVFTVLIFWKEFYLHTFDRKYSKTLGFSDKLLNFLISLLIVITVILGLQSVGVILMSSLLVGPAVAARQWTDKFGSLMVISAIFGALSGLLGTVFSSIETNMPTGPTIVVAISLIVLFSIFFAPKRGLISQSINKRKRRRELIALVELEIKGGGK